MLHIRRLLRIRQLVVPSWLAAWFIAAAAPLRLAAYEDPSPPPPAAAEAGQEQAADDQQADDQQGQAAKAGQQAGSQEKSLFLRLVRDDQGSPTSMETAIVRYVAADEEREGLIVDLIGVVHIGEEEYYEKLNRLFEQYDALLYELVAPEGTRVPKGAKSSGHPVGALQVGMKNMLELDYQLEFIDYSKENFVHADFSPEDFAESMSARGESIWGMMFKMMGQSIAQQNKNPGKSVDAELLLALFDPNRALALKRIMAQQFEDLEGMMTAFEGPDGSTIITERNKRALQVLAEQIEDGKKRLAIFYGAGHMPDMEKRLLADFGLKREGQQWLQAWNLTGRPKKLPFKKAPSIKKPAAEPETATPAAE